MQTFRINQETGGGGWVSLGRFPFDAGTAGRVSLTNDAEIDNVVIADGSRFDGFYSLLRVPAGAYTLTAQHPVLATAATANFDLAPGQVKQIDIVFPGPEGPSGVFHR